MPKPLWYDPETNPSQFLAALWRVRHLCTRAQATVPDRRAPGSYALIQAIMTVIDDYAERETGNREFFWNRPHSIG
jgi:hypothetical protein